MKCEICGKGPSDGTNLFRQNPKGETGIWRCAAHSKPVEDDLVKIVNALSMAAKRSGI